jgi:hypothetical protein
LIFAVLALVGTSILTLLAPSTALASSLAGPNVRNATALKSGDWGDAENIPGVVGTASFSKLYSLSCASAGNCSAVGQYLVSSDDYQAFVANERSGKWGKGETVPGTAALNAGDDASATSVSCRSAGNCSAGGAYTNAADQVVAFVVNERAGKWGDAEAVPGIANAAGESTMYSLSCASAGNCTASGTYEDSSGHDQAFVVSERDWNWGDSKEVPGTATLNAGGFAQTYSVSCASVGNCAAGGDYQNAGYNTAVFVASEKNGKWGNAVEVPGTATLDAGNQASFSSLSCASAGNCAGGGYYTNATFDTEVFVVNETNGRWTKAIEVPGIATLNAGGDSGLA